MVAAMRGGGRWRLQGEDVGEGKAVVALAADGLHDGGGEAGVGGEQFEVAAGSDDGGVGVVGVGYATVADDVVGEDEGAGTGELESPGKVVGVAGLVGVDEDEVEGFDVLGVKLGEGLEGGAEAKLYGVGEAGVGDVGEGDFGVFGIEFEGDEVAAGREGAGEADGAVAAEGADLEDAVGALHLGEELEEPALGRRDVDGGKIGGGVGCECGVEDGIGGHEGFGDVAVDGCPEGFGSGEGIGWRHGGRALGVRG